MKEKTIDFDKSVQALHTELQEKCINGREHEVQEILRDNIGDDYDLLESIMKKQDEDGRTILHLVCQSEKSESSRAIFSRLSEFPLLIRQVLLQKNSDQNTPMQILAEDAPRKITGEISGDARFLRTVVLHHINRLDERDIKGILEHLNMTELMFYYNDDRKTVKTGSILGELMANKESQECTELLGKFDSDYGPIIAFNIGCTHQLESLVLSTLEKSISKPELTKNLFVPPGHHHNPMMYGLLQGLPDTRLVKEVFETLKSDTETLQYILDHRAKDSKGQIISHKAPVINYLLILNDPEILETVFTQHPEIQLEEFPPGFTYLSSRFTVELIKPLLQQFSHNEDISFSFERNGQLVTSTNTDDISASNIPLIVDSGNKRSILAKDITKSQQNKTTKTIQESIEVAKKHNADEIVLCCNDDSYMDRKSSHAITYKIKRQTDNKNNEEKWEIHIQDSNKKSSTNKCKDYNVKTLRSITRDIEELQDAEIICDETTIYNSKTDSLNGLCDMISRINCAAYISNISDRLRQDRKERDNKDDCYTARLVTEMSSTLSSCITKRADKIKKSLLEENTESLTYERKENDDKSVTPSGTPLITSENLINNQLTQESDRNYLEKDVGR